MSDAVWLALIKELPSILAAIGSIGAVWLGIINNRKVKEVADSVNGMLAKNTAVNRSDAAQAATTVERLRGEGVASDLAARKDHP